uniref:F-box domain-containing protein n=1 Tax=Vitis vinifera TaxID=29760 RepID=F6I4X7_VITVI
MVGVGLEGLPTTLINEIIVKLDTETLCSVACVSRALRFAVSEALPLSSSLDLSAFSPDAQTLNHLVSRCKGLKILTLDCLRLDDSSITIFLGPHIQELNLLRCSLLSYQLLRSIGESLPNLRLLTLELSYWDLPEVFNRNLVQMLTGCSYLESLCLKIRGAEFDATFFRSIQHFLPKTVKILKLQPVLEQDVIRFIHELRVNRNILDTAEFGIPFSPASPGFKLQSLSLVLDIISDELISSITDSLPFLIELHLEDRPSKEPSPFHDLTNSGLQSLRRLEVLDLFGCKSIADSSLSSITCLNKLTTLNLGGADVTDRGLSVLSQGYSPISHLCLRGCKRVTDKGVSLLFHGCGVISKTLTALDLGHMPGISDKAILTIAAVGTGITELCIRYCFYVTDSSVEALATKRRLQDGRKPLRKLDLFHCTGLSVKSLESLKRPFFQALKWIGLGRTCLSGKANEILNERPWLTLCLDGCEMGCHDGWHFHRPETRDH